VCRSRPRERRYEYLHNALHLIRFIAVGVIIVIVVVAAGFRFDERAAAVLPTSVEMFVPTMVTREASSPPRWCRWLMRSLRTLTHPD